MLPLLVRLENTETSSIEEYAFFKSPVRIGRNMLNDLALDLPFISQWHAVVQFDDHATHYYDLGSTNGTEVGGARVEKNVPFPVAQPVEFRISKLRLTVARGQATTHTRIEGSPFVGSTPFATAAPNALLSTMAVNEANVASSHRLFERTNAARAEIARLKERHAAWREGWKALHADVLALLERAAPEDREMVVTLMQVDLAGIASEPQFQALAAQHRVELSGAAGAASSALRLLSQLANAFVPNVPAPATPTDLARFVSRLAAVLEASSASFVGLRKGHDQFGEEMALPHHRNVSEPTPLNTGSDPKAVLAYLLDWRVDSLQRVRELTSTYADIMMHEVALLNGMMEGVRGLLQRLGPAQIEREADQLPVKFGPFTFKRPPALLRSAARWKRYVDRHKEITEEDSGLTAAVFGAEFARAYAGVLGENFTDGAARRLNKPT